MNDLSGTTLTLTARCRLGSLVSFPSLSPAASAVWPESYAIPLAADGTAALVGELIRRDLFDGDLAIQASSAEGLFCWEAPQD